MTIIEIIEQSKKRNFQALQITEFKSEIIEIAILNDTLKKYDATDEISYEIKGKINDKFVKINTDYLEEEIFDLLKFKSENIESAYEDSFLEQKKVINSEPENRPDFNGKEEISTLINLNKYRQNFPKVVTIDMNFEEKRTQKRIINTYNVDISSNNNTCVFQVEATAKDENKVFNFEDSTYTISRDNLDLDKILIGAMEQAENGLYQEKLNSGKYNVIFSADFMSKILKELVPLLSKEQVRKKVSCLENKLNTKIFSSKINLIEDASNNKMPAYCAFDNEGSITRKKDIIKEGVLKTYLYNNKEAILDHCETTANGYGIIDVRNMYLKPENYSFCELLKQLKEGLYISSYLETGGMVLNPVNGDISIQVFGYIISKGKIKQGFEPCILSTTIFDLLNNITLLGNNLEFKTNNIASPAVLAQNMSISSN